VEDGYGEHDFERGPPHLRCMLGCLINAFDEHTGVSLDGKAVLSLVH
jgi:hypothetical protein